MYCGYLDFLLTCKENTDNHRIQPWTENTKTYCDYKNDLSLEIAEINEFSKFKKSCVCYHWYPEKFHIRFHNVLICFRKPVY